MLRSVMTLMEPDIKEKIEDANKKATDKVLNSKPLLVDVKPAIEVIPGMKQNMILHAGPPIEWQKMCGPMKGAIIGTMIFEGLAKTKDEAIKIIEKGEIEFSPNHEHHAVGPMAGTTSASMPVFVVKNASNNNTVFARMVEGKVQFGDYSDEAVSHLRFWREKLSSAIGIAARKSGGIDLKTIIAKALHRGDELHNRPVAASSLFANIIIAYMIEAGVDQKELLPVVQHLANDEMFFLGLSMGASKATAEAAHGIEYSTLVTIMARNGVEFGIKVSGLGDQWFTGQAGIINGLYFPGFGAQDAALDMGDSAITETAGIGGFALAAGQAIINLTGGTSDDAIRHSKEMYQITMTRNNVYTIPVFNFEGTATGIDIRKVVKTGILPIIDTAIAHKDAGVGMIGAGLVNPPMEAFKKALHAFAQRYSEK